MSFLDLSQVQAQTNSPLKPGVYTVKITSAEVKDTANKLGKYIQVKFEVTQPESDKGRVVMHRFNIQNKSEQAQQIGLSELKTMLLCSGHNGEKLDSVNELLGKTLMIKTKLDKGQNGVEYAGVKSFMTPKAPTEAQAPKAGF